MDVPKTILFLLIVLIPMSDSVESRVREAQKEKSVTYYQRKLIYNYVADGVKGPKEEMREKITLIKRILDEVSALAEICGACDSNPCLNGGTCIDEANGKYSCACAIGWKGDQCEKCHTALGMESGKIKDDQITSSTNEPERQASRGRLNFEVSPGKPGSWCSRVKDNDQWLQVDLGNGNRNVSGIATQGGTNYRGKARWVQKYRLAFSDDGVNFHYYKGGEATDKEFVANKDRDTIVYNELSRPITSRYIRIRPIPKGKRKNLFAMRVELYGCQDIDECSIVNDCHQDATCHNTEGSYNCICKNGFKGDGRLNCTDIDECSIENECHQKATCNNTKGSYNCTCKGGFKGDGRINCTEHSLQDSVIIGGNLKYFVMLSDWLKPVVQINGQWILCWRASLHGWTAATFHSLCDNKGPTVTIVKDTKNNMFGGYTSKPWQSINGAKNDPKAFLFSLKNPTNNPRTLPQLDKSSSQSVQDYAAYGPSFGQAWDLWIADRPNVDSPSYEHLGYTYTVPSGIRSDPFLTGKSKKPNYFEANEIETFYEKTG
ncbi:protein crumbs-like [Acropora millepora]|uniref:protein crumbs-like n=1 Tax=Acropora millepora TaxID=45264 RepID=UPI001CF5D158|nr:protein crumbs-like [Acropora millepora]